MNDPIIDKKPNWREYLQPIEELKQQGFHAHSGTLETFKTWSMLKEYFKTLERTEGQILSMEYEVAAAQRSPEHSRDRGHSR